MMIMGTSGHSLFGFLLSCLALAFLLLIRAQDQSGFISLDCGLPEGTSYTEKTTKINYVSDASFINTGVSRSVDSAYVDLDIYEMQLRKLRSFPDGIRNCYNISIKRATEYLIRASFLYGNYDGLDSPPMFDLYIGNSLWETFNGTGDDMGVFIELIHVTSSNEIHICLINTGNGVPFISTLEFRPSFNITYYTSTASLSLFARLDYGSADGQYYRFPLDVYDRIWLSYHSNDSTRVSTNITLNSEDYGFQLPSIVMSTASTSKDASTTLEISWDTIDSSQYFVIMHFAELEIPQVNQTREFTIWHNGNLYSRAIIPEYLSTMSFLSPKPLKAASSHFLTFVPTENSTLPPIINAFELYGMKEISELETDQGDVDAVTNIRSNYGIKKDWQGDPCVPMEYTWSGLNCSNKTAPRIISLDLSGSGLVGEISSYISNLTMLQILDLSNNGLTGEIPEFLVNLPNLRILSLTRNKFTGLIPKVLLQRAEAGLLILSVGENPDLCTSLKCDNKKKKKNKRNKYLVPVILASIIAVFLPILIITLVIYKRRKQRENLKRSIQERLLKSKNQQVHYSEILVITDNFKTTLGEGGFGKVYLGVLSDKTQVAVKLLSSISQQGYNEFRAEAQILTVVHHRNLVSLVGYCDEAENKALIYEFMGNGNLGNLLSDSSAKVLSWMERLQIAVDAAQGLEYLHNGCVPPIIHRDIKSSNILLNEKMQAKISDFGLSRVFANENDTHFSTCPAGTFGYVDPTVHLSRNFIKKSDVYSFGIILLELITGHPAIIKSSEVNTHIVDWVKPLIAEGNIENIVDPRLEGSIESCSAKKFVELALSCTLPTSAGRPDMSNVVLQLIECLEIVQDRTPQIPPNN
ncbi:putative leucine-rich repeat receptor-like protein kinase At2g19210, partial [Cucurbita moschata]|uniref:Leucine-rich repeat receptor-like protein kinase At2g19210 n=1 Tax=Cucurbita moschata TaxID=3662 RepID=A0A6J1HHV2_CUCMO